MGRSHEPTMVFLCVCVCVMSECSSVMSHAENSSNRVTFSSWMTSTNNSIEDLLTEELYSEMMLYSYYYHGSSQVYIAFETSWRLAVHAHRHGYCHLLPAVIMVVENPFSSATMLLEKEKTQPAWWGCSWQSEHLPSHFVETCACIKINHTFLAAETLLST